MNSQIMHRHCDGYEQLPLMMIARCKRYCCMFARQSLYADGLASLRSAMILRQSPPDGATQESLINGSLISCGSSRNCIAYRDQRHLFLRRASSAKGDARPAAATSAATGLALHKLDS